MLRIIGGILAIILWAILCVLIHPIFILFPVILVVGIIYNRKDL